MNESLDLNTMMKRLSVLQSLPMNSNVMSDRDDDDDDDDDEEEEDSEFDEESILSKDKSKDTLKGSQSTSLIDDSKENEEFPNECNEHDELNNQEARKPPAAELMNAKDNDSPLIVDAGPPIHPNSYEYMKSAEKSSIPYFQPISINTEMFPSSHNRDYKVFSMTQQIDAHGEKEKLKAENEKLIKEIYRLKLHTKENNEKQIEQLSQENKRLKADLMHAKRLITEQESNTKNLGYQNNRIEILEMENRRLREDMNNFQSKNLQLTQHVEKLQKYENYFKGASCQVNNKVYQIVNKVGEGGFSEVFHCIFLKESKSYALKKVNLDQLGAESLEFIMNEIELLKKLQSTNKVIQLIDYEYMPQKKQLCMVMELGSTDLNAFFKKEIQKNGCVKEPARTYYWLKMLEAVHAIHQHGIIHSDIKPSNFLVVGCEIKLIDFNISNNLSDKTSITTVCDCGTLNYMAPESLMKNNESKTKINQMVDVWSLGVILYFITYGRLPFQHIKNQYQLIFAICDSEQRELKFDPNINIDQDLMDVLKKSLNHLPIKRYSVEELLSHPYIKKKM